MRVEDVLLGVVFLQILFLAFQAIDLWSRYRSKRQRRKSWLAQDKPRRRKEFPDPLDPEISVEMVNWGHGAWR